MRGVELHHLTRNAWRIRRKEGNGSVFMETVYFNCRLLNSSSLCLLWYVRELKTLVLRCSSLKILDYEYMRERERVYFVTRGVCIKLSIHKSDISILFCYIYILYLLYIFVFY